MSGGCAQGAIAPGVSAACDHVAHWLYGPKLDRWWRAQATANAVLNEDKVPVNKGVLVMWQVGSDEKETYLGPVKDYMLLLGKNQLHNPDDYADYGGKNAVYVQEDWREKFLADTEIKKVNLPAHDDIKFEGDDIGNACVFQKDGIEYSGTIIATKTPTLYVLTPIAQGKSGVLHVIPDKHFKMYRDQVATTGTAASRDDLPFGVAPCKVSGVEETGKLYNLGEVFGVLSAMDNEEIELAVKKLGSKTGFMQGPQLESESLEINTIQPCLQLKRGRPVWSAELVFMWRHQSGKHYVVPFDSDLEQQVQKLSISDVSVDETNLAKFGSVDIKYFSVLSCHGMEVTVHDGDQLIIETRVQGHAHMLRLLENPIDTEPLNRILGFEFPMKVTQERKPSQIDRVGQEVLKSTDASVEQFHLYLAQASGAHGLEPGEALKFAAQKLMQKQGAAQIDGAADTSTGALKPGANVVIHSLQQNEDLNGRQAVVLRQIGAGDDVRWEVQTTAGRTISVRPKNLVQTSASGSAAVGRAAKRARTAKTTASKSTISVTREKEGDTRSMFVCTNHVLRHAMELKWITYDTAANGLEKPSATFHKNKDQSMDDFIMKCLVKLLENDGESAEIHTETFNKLCAAKHITFATTGNAAGGITFHNTSCQACQRQWKQEKEQDFAGGRPSTRFQIHFGDATSTLTDLLNQHFLSVRQGVEREKAASDAAVAAMRSGGTTDAM